MSPVLSNTSRLLCIDLVLHMGWVNSPDLFFPASDTIVDNTNAYALDPTFTFAIYPPTAEVYHTSAAPPASPNRLQYANVYMDDLLCADKGGAAQQQRVLDLMFYDLKEIFPYIPGEIKDLVRLKKALDGNGDWKTTKEILRWVVDKNKGTLLLSTKS